MFCCIADPPNTGVVGAGVTGAGVVTCFCGNHTGLATGGVTGGTYAPPDPLHAAICCGVGCTGVGIALCTAIPRP